MVGKQASKQARNEEETVVGRRRRRVVNSLPCGRASGGVFGDFLCV